MKIIASGAAIAILATTVLAAAPAQAVPAGPLAVTTSSLSIATSTSCATVPLTWYLTSAPSDVTEWSVNGDIVDDAGASRGGIFEYESLPVSQAGGTYTLCGLAEGVTSFTVAADISGWTPDFTRYSLRFVDTLTVTRTTPPPPPPAQPAETTPAGAGAETFPSQLAFDGKPLWFRHRTYARIGAALSLRGGCNYGARRVTLVGKRSAGDWKQLDRWTADDWTYAKARVPYSFRKVRFEVPANSMCSADVTDVVKVPRRPA